MSEQLFTGDAEVDVWKKKAECKNLTDLFFPPPAEPPQARDRREAMALSFCASCVVIRECRDYARTHREYGIWGGEREDERNIADFAPNVSPSTVRTTLDADIVEVPTRANC